MVATDNTTCSEQGFCAPGLFHTQEIATPAGFWPEEEIIELIFAHMSWLLLPLAHAADKLTAEVLCSASPGGIVRTAWQALPSPTHEAVTPGGAVCETWELT